MLTMGIQQLSAQSNLIGPDTLRIFNGGVWGVYDTMKFNSSMVFTTRANATSNLMFSRDGGYVGESNLAHVDGYVEKRGVLPLTFRFPIGHKGVLKPCEIEAPALNFDSTFAAAYFREHPGLSTLPSGAMNILSRNPNVLEVSPIQYWDINGKGFAKIKLFWDPTDNLVNLTLNNFNDLIIVGWDGFAWAPIGKTAVTGTLAGTGSITSTFIVPNNYFAFTFALFNRIPQILTRDTFTLEDNPVVITTNISGKDGIKDTIDYFFCKLPVNGSITLIDDTTFRYTPKLHFNGLDSVCLRICDRVGNCDIKVVHIQVIPVNDTPIINHPAVVINEDDSTNICPTIFDPDMGDIHNTTIICGPNHGVATIYNDTCIKYVPNLDYNGNDTLCIVICDQVKACDTIRVPIKMLPIYDSLIFVQGSVIASENEDTTFTPYKYDPDGDFVTLTFCDGRDTNKTAHGNAVIIKNNVVSYEPAVNYSGFDTVCLIACAKNTPNKCKTIYVPILVLDGRKIIVILNDDSYTLESDALNIPIETDSVRKGILANDIIVPFTNQMTVLIEPVNGSLSKIQGYLKYTPVKDFEGLDSFEYYLCIESICDTAWVKVRTSRTYMNMITPNGDGKNEYFELPILENYRKAEVYIYNRWGDMVWVSLGEYKNDKFAGKSREGSNLPDGTYYYVIKFNDPNKEDKADFLELFR